MPTEATSSLRRSSASFLTFLIAKTIPPIAAVTAKRGSGLNAKPIALPAIVAAFPDAVRLVLISFYLLAVPESKFGASIGRIDAICIAVPICPGTIDPTIPMPMLS